jgi:hypothetical protein
MMAGLARPVNVMQEGGVNSLCLRQSSKSALSQIVASSDVTYSYLAHS